MDNMPLGSVNLIKKYLNIKKHKESENQKALFNIVFKCYKAIPIGIMIDLMIKLITQNTNKCVFNVISDEKKKLRL